MGETVDFGLIVTLMDGSTINEILAVESSLDEEEAEYLVGMHLRLLLTQGFSLETLTGYRYVSPHNIASVEYVRPTLVMEA